MRSLFIKTATVKRLSYTGDVSSYSTQSGTIHGFFAPLDQNQVPKEIKIASQAHKYTCEGGSSITAADILTIDSTDYAVRGIRRYTMGSLDLLDVILEKSVKI